MLLVLVRVGKWQALCLTTMPGETWPHLSVCVGALNADSTCSLEIHNTEDCFPKWWYKARSIERTRAPGFKPGALDSEYFQIKKPQNRQNLPSAFLQSLSDTLASKAWVEYRGFMSLQGQEESSLAVNLN